MLLTHSPRLESLLKNCLGIPTASLGEPHVSERGDLTWSIAAWYLSDLGELVPSISDIGSPDLQSRFVIRATGVDGTVGEVRLGWIGGGQKGSSHPPDPGPLRLDIDTVFVTAPLRALEVGVEFSGSVRPSKDLLIGVSLRQVSKSSARLVHLSEGRLVVPPLSQFEQSLSLGPRICSPTAVAMVLNFYGYATSPLEIAERSYDAAHDLYGVWPRNVWAVAACGVRGFLMHFDSWTAVDALLAKRIPIVASIRYRSADLTGAAFYRPNDELTGHLVVVTGAQGTRVCVNDPAGSSAAAVERSYDMVEFERVWFDRSAVGYVLIPPDFGEQ
jgi:hypothetical protein